MLQEMRSPTVSLGIQITVYGTLDAPDTNGPPNATFSTDGTTPVVFNSTGTIILENSTLVNSFVSLYQSPDLSKGQHVYKIGTSLTVFGITGPTTGPSAAVLVGFSLDRVPHSNFTGPEIAPPIKHHPMFHVEGLSSDREHTINE